MKTLRPYQREAVDILANGGLNASGLGAGKTLIGVETARKLRLGRVPRILVIAPVTSLYHWEDTYNEQFPSLAALKMIHRVGTHTSDKETWKRLTGKEPGVYIMSWNAMHGGVPEWARREGSTGKNRRAAQPKVTKNAVRKAIAQGHIPPWTRTGTWDLVILDEIHRACNRRGVPRYTLKEIKADRIQALSHTPGGNAPEGLWTVLNLLWPERYPSFWDWAARYFRVTEKVVDRSGATTRTIGAEWVPGALWNDIPAVVRYHTEEVFEQLPPVIERTVTVPLQGLQEDQYRDFEEQSLAWLSDLPIAAPLPLSQRIRLRQIALGTLKAEEITKAVTSWMEQAGVRRLAEDDTVIELTLLEARTSEETGKTKYKVAYSRQVLDISYEENQPQPKLDALKDILADLPDGEPLLVWTHSAKWARMAEKALGGRTASWTSSTTDAKRRKIKDGAGTEYRVLIAQLQSLSESVDWLKDAFRCEVIASPTEDAVINEQAEGRLRRPGQKSPVQRWRLTSENTIDDEVYQNNLMKRARMGLLYGDNPGQKKAA